MGDDLRMKALSDTCRHCAESCAAMAGGSDGMAGRRRAGAVMSRHKTD
jgi:hypothetical protein